MEIKLGLGVSIQINDTNKNVEIKTVGISNKEIIITPRGNRYEIN